MFVSLSEMFALSVLLPLHPAVPVLAVFLLHSLWVFRVKYAAGQSRVV